MLLFLFHVLFVSIIMMFTKGGRRESMKILSRDYYKACILSFSIVLLGLMCLHKCAHVGAHSASVPLSGPVLIRMF